MTVPAPDIDSGMNFKSDVNHGKGDVLRFASELAKKTLFFFWTVQSKYVDSKTIKIVPLLLINMNL